MSIKRPGLIVSNPKAVVLSKGLVSQLMYQTKSLSLLKSKGHVVLSKGFKVSVSSKK